MSLLYSLILLGCSVVIPMQLFAEEKTDIIQKSTPTGIWCLLPSYSYKHPEQMDRLNDTPCWTNPNVDGIVLRADWDKIEPTESKIDFSYYDRGFELAKKYNKRIEIILRNGSTPLALKNFTSITITANQLIICRYHGIPCFRRNLVI